MRPIFFPLATLLLSLPLGARAAEKVVWQRTLKDRIGHEWTGELLEFALPKDLEPSPTRHRLMLDDGDTKREIPYQVPTHAKGQAKLLCLLDLPAFGERTLRLEEAPAAKDIVAPMPASRKDGLVVVDNGTLRLVVPDDEMKEGTAEKDVLPPLLRMQNVGGSPWVGAGHFTGTGRLVRSAVATLADPVATDVVLNYDFENGIYNVFLRVIRGQPEVLWFEQFDFKGQEAALELELSGFVPALGVWDYYRSKCDWRKTALGVSKAYPIEAGHEEATTFMPWIPWWMDDISTWLELWDSAKVWAVGIFTGNPLEWNPEDRASYAASAFRLSITKDRKATLTLPLRKGKRSWGLSLAPRTPDTHIGQNTQAGPPDSARRQIKYAESPLNEVKDYVLEDATPPESYPLFAITKEDRQRLQEALARDYPFLNALKGADAWAKTAKPLDEPDGFWHMGVAPDPRPWPKGLAPKESIARAALLGLTDAAKTHARCMVMHEGLQCTENILRHVTGPGMGIAPHNWMTSGPTQFLHPLIDLTMPDLTERERQVLRARMLFLAYKLSSEKYWSPRLGFAANPNMTTLVYAQLAFISFLFPKHPMAEQWRKAGVGEMLREAETWSGPNGGWLEAPHYATVALDLIIAIGYARKNLGLGDDLLCHERLKKAVEWLAKISTPPDPRFKGLRHSPPIGNTWLYETSCLYAYMAKVWRERDPDYANAMRWMWEQQGLPTWPGIGGAYPATDGIREVLFDATPSKGAPKWGSEHFPGSGVVLRAHFPSERESQLYLIQGNLHDHYDDDKGSFELWGKGRPLCGDFGYSGFDPADHHNRVDINGEGKIVAFTTQPAADFVHSQQGAWDRYVLFVKNADPLGPNYVLIRDCVGKAAPRAGNWWLWLNTEEEPRGSHTETAEGAEKNGKIVAVKGRDDVDLDLWFAPSGASLLPTEKGIVKTTPLSIKTHSAGPPSTDQRGLHLVLPPDSALSWLLYPRLRDEKPPTITPLGREEVLKVESPAGTDYVFLSPQPTETQFERIRFKGTAGIIQVRQKQVTLTLCQPGEVRFDGLELASDQPTTRQFPR
jgi:hypothetical protein